MSNPLINFLQLLRYIPAEDAAVITSHFEHKVFKEGDFLFKGHRVCNELFFVCKGVLRIVTTNEKGIDITHFFFKENQICTILQSFNDETPTEPGIQAACDAEVMVISKSKLLALYARLPYIKEIIERINQQHLIEKVRVRNSYLGQDAENQYRLFIMQQPDIALRVPLKDIASYLGITPQSLSRIRKNIR
ncbi:Crp/Fnr family transcriptional regulator [Mucilaginibacter sabulilitoris]|uniref:Crp/Fnr family transcriptional regulator n=1 Tax=Mucilaginibacter sabulilitoris TaxID=1173583 RepID=A0ABZ0TKU8_9SPHI|nr:Crp/Fnr family transcriptional regulator [Mucilaginibacter sabulilitoris]WPU93810.1 Crp/Fnr family transcriptional regulator [Mucilaginibacter sabulilitoris]